MAVKSLVISRFQMFGRISVAIVVLRKSAECLETRPR